MTRAISLCVILLVACGGTNNGEAPAGPDASATTPDSPDDPSVVICGDGKVGGSEVCDDGNTDGMDGCAADCAQIETGWVCPEPGIACVVAHVCGNGILETNEQCDDRNTANGDGCTAACALEPGWACPVPGIRCTAAMCGDGIVAGFETCDDGTPGGGDGCSAECRLEPGYKCAVPGAACVPTLCGDGNREGTEECDDGNNDLGDGCDPLCKREPICAAGTCMPVCGDGVVQPGEACDDGNLFSADGCSSACTVETGFTCSAATASEPASVAVTIVYRDFRGFDLVGGHPDFERYSGNDQTILASMLGLDHKPVYAGSPTTPTTSGQTAFDSWYRDDPLNMTYAEQLVLPRTGPGTYIYDNANFFPLDGRGWVGAGMEPARNNGHNFGFTSELRYWFTYAGGEVLSFRGDDDVWVFINNRKAIDLGGVHGAQSASITLDATAAQNLAMTVGGTYEVVVFQAERHTTASSYKLTLKGFNAAVSTCDDTCGDGITSSNEACDDGVNMGGYGSCQPGCLGFGPRCGDGVVQAAHEQCDDGINAGGYGKCQPTCTLGARCGDGIVQAPYEDCDDGNTVGGDSCDETCHIPLL